jgi:hypothetical protein
MNNNFLELIAQENIPENSARLTEAVNHRIRRYIRIRKTLFGGISIASFLATIPSAYYAYKLWAESDFISYASLLISDSRYVLGNITDYILSIVSTAPISSTILVLAAVCIFAASLRKYMSFGRSATAYPNTFSTFANQPIQ